MLTHIIVHLRIGATALRRFQRDGHRIRSGIRLSAHYYCCETLRAIPLLRHEGILRSGVGPGVVQTVGIKPAGPCGLISTVKPNQPPNGGFLVFFSTCAIVYSVLCSAKVYLRLASIVWSGVSRHLAPKALASGDTPCSVRSLPTQRCRRGRGEY